MRAAEALISENPAPFDPAALFDGLAGISSVAIAVSGGSDSVALLRLVVAHIQNPSFPRKREPRLSTNENVESLGSRFRGNDDKQETIKLVALTVDHGLRVASTDEAAQVSHWCASLGVEHHILHWQGEKPATGIQAKARVARYDLMSAFCKVHGIDVLLTAHTLDDQAETVAMRAARTRSAAALAGIWPATDWNGVKVVRPLLGVRRDALRRWLFDIGQPWLDDPSNDDRRFERVRVRQALQGADVVALAELANASRIEAERISDEADLWIANFVKQHPESHFSFDKVRLLQEERLVRRAVFGKLVARAGSGASLTVNELERLVGFLGTGGRRTLGGALIAARLHEVIIVREAGRITPDWMKVGESGVLDWDRRFRVTAPPGSHVGPVLLAPALIRLHGVPYYVHEACPAVRLANGQVVLAGNPSLPGVSVELL